MFASLTVAAVILGTPQAARTVTYSRSCATAKAILAELEPLIGRKLLTSPVTQDCKLVVRLNKASTEDALERIAWAVGGSWKEEGGTLRLVRTNEDSRAEQLREQRNRLDFYRKGLAERRAKSNVNAAFDESAAQNLARRVADLTSRFQPNSPNQNDFWQGSQQVGRAAPSGRALTRLLNLFTPEDLASLPAGIKVVYSTTPNRSQRALGPEAQRVIRLLQQEQALWAEALEKNKATSPKDGDTIYPISGVYRQDEIPDKFGKVLLTMFRRPSMGGSESLGLQLLVADPKGRFVMRSDDGLSLSVPPAKPTEGAADGPKVPIPATLIRIFTQITKRGDNRDVPADLLEIILTPTRHEPLSVFAGDLIESFAKALDVNLVAELVDQNFWPGVNVTPTSKSVSASVLMSSLEQMFEVEKGKGWIAIRPKQAYSDRPKSADRRVMEGYLRRINEKPALPLAESAQWAAKLPSENDNPLPQMFSQLMRMLRGPASVYQDSNVLRFYGSLTIPQKRAALATGGLPVAALTDEQKVMVSRITYAQHVQVQLEPQLEVRGQRSEIDMELFYNGLMMEPTESLPNGLTAESRIHLSEEKEMVAFTPERVMPEGYTMGSQAISASQLGWQIFAQSRPDLFPWMNEAGQRQDTDNLLFGYRLTVKIKIPMGPYSSIQSSLEDREYTVSKPVRLNQLPAEFQQRVQRAIESNREAHKNSTPGTYGGGGGTKVPPPSL